MNADVFFPSQLHWTSQQLADAVPLPLHQLFAFHAVDRADAANTAPAASPAPRRYLPATPAPDVFRVR